jgi:PTH1 family peptidyl-tRNA hydrolase
MKFESSGSLSQATDFKKDKYLLSEVARLPNILLIKPQTFMNKSGDAVKKTVLHYKIRPLQDLVVVHDDLDIPFGKFKVQNQGPKAHNGLTDIQNKLQTMDFLRIRIGVDNRPAENRINGEEYVLQDFSKEEMPQLPELFKKIAERFTASVKSNNY